MEKVMELSEGAVRRLHALAAEMGAKTGEQAKAIVAADLTDTVGRMQRAAGDAETLRQSAATEHAALTRQIAANKATLSEQASAIASNDERLAKQTEQIRSNDATLAKQDAARAKFKALVDA